MIDLFRNKFFIRLSYSPTQVLSHKSRSVLSLRLPISKGQTRVRLFCGGKFHSNRVRKVDYGISSVFSEQPTRLNRKEY